MSERERFEQWYASADPGRRCAFERLVSDERYTSLEVEWAYRGFKAGADLAAERELELQMTVYSALEMLKEGNGMRAMAILSSRVDKIEGALAKHEHNEGGNS